MLIREMPFLLKQYALKTSMLKQKKFWPDRQKQPICQEPEC